MDPIAFSPLVNFIVSAVVGQRVGGNAQKSEHLTAKGGEDIGRWWRWGGRKGGRVTRVL